MSLKLRRNDGYQQSAYNLDESANSVLLSVGGVARLRKNIRIDTRNGAECTLCTWTGDVAHDSDGTLSLAVAASFTVGGTSLSGGSLSGSINVPSVPRASTASLSLQSVAPGGSLTVTLVSHSAAFTHRLIFSVGSRSQTVTLAAGVASYTLSVPQNWANEIPDAKSGKVSLSLKTYSGAVCIGTKQYSFTLAIPGGADYLPEFDVTVSLVNGTALGNTGEYIKGKSRVRVSVGNVVCKYGATVKSTGATVCAVTKSLPAEFELTSHGSVSITVGVKDSRGYLSTVTRTVTVRDYREPSVRIVSAVRCDADGNTVQHGGGHLAVEYAAAFSSVNGKNSASVELSYKSASDDGFCEWFEAESSPVIISGISDSSSYLIRLRISDTVSGASAPVIFRVSSTDIAFNIKNGGKGAAFGCFAEHDNELTVNYDLRINGGLVYHGISDLLSYSASYCNAVSSDIRYFDCMGTVFMSARFAVSAEISAGTTVFIGTLSRHFPQRANALAACINGSSANCLAYIRPDGRISFCSSEKTEIGQYIYINGFWFNDEQPQEG